MKRYWQLIFLLSCYLPLALSQTGLQRRTTSPPAYTLGPGDQLVVHLADVEEVTDKPIRIDPGGFIDLPLAGRVQAAGLTLDQLKVSLGERFSKYVTSPEITVNLAESTSQPVSVIGEVNNPGVHQIGSSKNLLEIISLSGGLKQDAGPSVIVTRDPRYGAIPGPHSSLNENQYSTATFSLDALLSSKNPEDNIPIQPNDVISVPRAELVYVLGDVHKAGGFQLSTHPSVSLLQALSLAEGLAPDNSASHARILRQYPGGDGVPREIHVDIPRIYAGKDPDVPLLANDVLFVPHSGIKVTSRRAMEAAIGITSGLLIYR
jgi:polysaccharide export outer membrane protein